MAPSMPELRRGHLNADPGDHQDAAWSRRSRGLRKAKEHGIELFLERFPAGEESGAVGNAAAPPIACAAEAYKGGSRD